MPGLFVLGSSLIAIGWGAYLMLSKKSQDVPDNDPSHNPKYIEQDDTEKKK